MVRPRNGKWEADVKVGSLPRIRKTFNDKHEAERFEASAKATLKAGALTASSASLAPTQSGDTVGKWLPLLASDIWGDGVHEVNMRNVIRTWVEFFGPDKMLTDIRTADCERFTMQRRAIGNAPSTINQYTTRLSKMLKKALRLELIHTMPIIVSAGKVGHRQRFLTQQEIDALLSHLPPYYQKYVTFLLFTGARRSEAEGLLWHDVDETTITFKDTKNGKDRTIPTSTQVRQILNDLEASSRDGTPGQRVFSEHSRTTFRRKWKEAKHRAGLGDDCDVVPHVLRHTCASRLVKAGVHLATVQRFLGHSDIQMTMRYVHLDMSSMNTAADALSAL